MNIGPEIKRIRESKGIKQKVMAKDLHMSNSVLSRIEKDSKNTSYDVIYNIYTYLDDIDPLTLKFTTKEQSFSPSMEHLINKLRLLPHEKQDEFVNSTSLLATLLLDYNNTHNKK